MNIPYFPYKKNFSGRLKKSKRLVKYFFYNLYFKMLEKCFAKKVTDCKKIPIIINSFNRLEGLKKMIESLEQRGYFNIHILDNCSTYPPLLEFYETCAYPIHKLPQNYGHLALWKSNIGKQFIRNYYVYTDPDIVPIEACPDNFLEVFYNLMQTYPLVKKVGFSLKIDDLPDTYSLKDDVVKWESQYFDYEIEKGVFQAPIDTTFALYRPFVKGGSDPRLFHFRCDYPYMARHLSWYSDSNHLTEEELYYANHVKTSTHWSKLSVTN